MPKPDPQTTLEVCAGHRERETPLILTFRWPDAEYWCPHCGSLFDIFGAGRCVTATPELQQRLKEDTEANIEKLKGAA